MLNVALNERTTSTDFDLEQEVLYFKVGVEGLVSFHGKNYNRKVKMSDAELRSLLNNSGYYRLNSNCYVNVAKIKSIASGIISFDSDFSCTKMLPISKRTQLKIEQLCSNLQ